MSVITDVEFDLTQRELIEKLEPHLVSTGDIASATGIRVTTVRKWTTSPLFPRPVLRRGRCVLYLDSEVAAFMRMRNDTPDAAAGPQDLSADARVAQLKSLIEA